MLCKRAPNIDWHQGIDREMIAVLPEIKFHIRQGFCAGVPTGLRVLT
jgi:hypothetical protein